MIFVGIDVAKDTHYAAVSDDSGAMRIFPKSLTVVDSARDGAGSSGRIPCMRYCGTKNTPECTHSAGALRQAQTEEETITAAETI